MTDRYYKRVILIGRRGKVTPEQKIIYDTLVSMRAALITNKFEVAVDAETQEMFRVFGTDLDGPDHTNIDKYTVGVVVGGDGTMLDAAKTISLQIPLIGVNFGHMGFITDIPRVKAIPTVLNMLLEGRYTTEERTLIQCHENPDTDPNVVHTYRSLGLALNDFVIVRKTCSMIDFTVSINDDQAYRFKADGLIVTTPTGSTAYGLAAGGSIIHPSTKVLGLIPMFPQTLSCRPMVVDEKSKIKITVTSKDMPEITLDGQPRRVLGDVDKPLDVSFLLTASPKKAIFLHPNTDSVKYSYFEALSQKLGWNHQV